MNVHPLDYVHLQKHFLLRHVKSGEVDECAVLNLDNGVHNSINDDARFVLTLLTGEQTTDEIIGRVSVEYGIPSEESKSSVDALLNRFESLGLLRHQEGPRLGYVFPRELPRMTPLDHLYIRLTNACNLKCLHCSVDSGSRYVDEMDRSSVLKIIDQAYDISVPRITFTGGEPTLVSFLPELVRHAADKPIKVCLMTNGLTVTPSLARELKDGGLRQVNVSLDGACSDTHDRQRGVPGAFQKALGAIRMFQDLGVFVETTTVINPENALEVSRILELGHSLGVTVMKFLPIVPSGRGQNCEHQRALACYTAACATHFEAFGGLQIQERDFSKPGPELDQLRCNAGSGVLAVRANGDVIPCNNFDTFVLGNLQRERLADIHQRGTVAAALTDLIRIKGSVCEKCSLLSCCRGGCPMAAFSYSGDYLACDETRKPLIMEYLKRKECAVGEEEVPSQVHGGNLTDLGS